MTRMIICLSAVMVAMETLPLAADEPSANEATTRIFKYTGTREGVSAGKPMMMLCVVSRFGAKDVPASSTSPTEIAIPNNDPNGAKLDPATVVMAAIKDVKAGDFVRVDYRKSQGRYVCDKVEKVTPKPAEIDPDAYEFVKVTSAKGTVPNSQGLLVRKADKEQTILIPIKKNGQGKMAPDEDMLAQAGKLNAGDYLDIDVAQAGGVAQAKSIRAYDPPKSAFFTKVASEKGDGGVALATVEVKTADDKAMVLYVRPAREGGPSDPNMVAKAKAFKAGQEVRYKSVSEGGKEWLTDIKPGASDEIVLVGTFVWKGSKPTKPPNPLKALLTPSGPNEWKAVYYFPWGNASKTWTGTIKGDLKNGDVSGDTTGEAGRIFIFTGTSKDGVLTFDCIETTRPQREQQAKGTLKPAEP